MEVVEPGTVDDMEMDQNGDTVEEMTIDVTQSKATVWTARSPKMLEVEKESFGNIQEMIGFWEIQEEMEMTPVLEKVMTKRRRSTRMEEFRSFFGQEPNDDIYDDHPDSTKHVFNFSTLTSSRIIPNITITGGSEGQVWIGRKSTTNKWKFAGSSY